jgi:UrcA family protein
MTVNRFSASIAASLFSVLSSGLCMLPAAADSLEPLAMTVNFADLDLSHPHAAVVLYGRIQSAAQQVCSPFAGMGLSARMHMDACVRKAISDAVTSVGKPALFAVYSAKMGKAGPVRLASSQYR